MTQKQGHDVPPLADYLPMARLLAHRHARRTADVDDLVQEGMLVLHRALLEVADGALRDPWAWGSIVLGRAMSDWYAGRWEQRWWEHAVSLDVEDEDAAPVELPAPERPPPEDSLLLRDWLRDLEAALGEAHGWVALNLVAPGDELGVWVLREMRAKGQRMEEDPELGLRGVHTARISHRQIREALGWSTARWRDVLGEIRTFTRTWMEARGAASF